MCAIKVNLRLLKAKVEFLWVGGLGRVCKVIFVSNPTFVLRLCCVVVGIVTTFPNYPKPLIREDVSLILPHIQSSFCLRSISNTYSQLLQLVILSWRPWIPRSLHFVHSALKDLLQTSLEIPKRLCNWKKLSENDEITPIGVI